MSSSLSQWWTTVSCFATICDVCVLVLTGWALYRNYPNYSNRTYIYSFQVHNFIYFIFFSNRSVAVKRSMSCFISASLERFGAGKFLHCSKDVLDKVLPALVQLTTDPSPEARY